MFEQLPERPLMLNQKKKPSPFVIFLSALLGVFLLILAFFAIVNLWLRKNCDLVEVSGTSMQNTLQDGDLLYVRKMEAHRGDIVIISVKQYNEENVYHFSGDYIIKRLIATEGDTVKCEGGVVSIQYAGNEEFVVLNEEYVKGTTPDFDAITVGEGGIFFLGDNRENSYDSTEIGCLGVKDIVGVVPPWSLKIKSYTKYWGKMKASALVHP